MIMMLFWKRTTATGITASIVVGIATSVGLILFSPEALYPVWLEPRDRAGPAEQSRYRLDPAQLPGHLPGLEVHEA